MTIDKIRKRYSHLKTSEFTFHSYIDNVQYYYANELEFMAFIILNPWFQKHIGIDNITRNANSSPDIKANIYGTNQSINIEIEFNAHSFLLHNHDGNYIDLVISFVRSNLSKMISNIPVWSLYRMNNGVKNKSEKYIYTLDDDINRDFDELKVENYKSIHYKNLRNNSPR